MTAGSGLKSAFRPGMIGVPPAWVDMGAVVAALRAEGATVIELDATGRDRDDLLAEARRKMAECGDPDPIVIIRER